MNDFFLFLLVLFVAAVVMRSSLFVNLLYLFSGIYLIGRLWNSSVLRRTGFTRTLTPRAFAGEDVVVQLELFNRSLLPAAWLRIEESLPVELSKGSFKRIITLPSRGSALFEYQLHTHKRGFYKVGPLRVAGGDLFGLSAPQTLSGGAQLLVVYPRIYNLPGLGLPSRSPLGSLRTNQPIFEDPTRVRSKRDYVSGDSQRRIDWKASAASGRLQVKQFEPSIALETMIFLNLNAEEYDLRLRYESTELAIVVAASIASWVNARQQSVGLATNGLDPFCALEDVLQAQMRIDPSAPLEQKDDSGEDHSVASSLDLESFTLEPVPPLTPRKGQLMRILDILARVQPASTDVLARKPARPLQIQPSHALRQPQSFLDLLHGSQADLSWGTTLILVTGSASETLFDTIFKLRRRGLLVVIVLVGQVAYLQQIRERARHFHVPLFHFRSEIEISQRSMAAAAAASLHLHPGPAGQPPASGDRSHTAADA